MLKTSSRPRPTVLCILDGWGYRADRSDNGIALAQTPVWDRLMRTSPHSLLEASALDVGLPRGQMGNSEVGHMNIGAGRVVMQDLPRIDQAIEDGSLAQNPALGDFVAKVKAGSGTAHLMGLMSPGGVHSHQDHLAALARLLAQHGLKVQVHAFLDGRDTPPKSARDYLKTFQDAVADLPQVKIATVCGRFYAMDRDKRWDRVEKAWHLLVEGKGETAPDADTAVAKAYEAGQTDEFVLPTVIGGFPGIKGQDGVIMGHFRADRAREILDSLLDPDFSGFERPSLPKFSGALGLTEYSSGLNRFMATIFPPEDLKDTFGEVVADHGLTQLHIAETEKYAHVTFFFNGGKEDELKGETRILVPSPKVATYDLQPEMSAPEVTDKLIDAIENARFDVIIVNYANTDMVGHTGDLKAAITAVEAVDKCLGRLSDAVVKAGGVMLITADHGNAEQMRDEETGQAHTAHTLNPVPLILVNAPANVTGLSDGKLADIAPTLLDLMKIPQPAAMTGHPLLLSAAARASA